MKIYQNSGYIDFKSIYENSNTFLFIIGARATGKTYSALEYLLYKQIKFMLMRRTQAEADLISNPSFNPFKSLNHDKKVEVQVKSTTKYTAAFTYNDTVIGHTCALSTVSNIRGLDLTDVDCLLYDEFIPERHKHPIKEEAAAFFNAIETIGRNRELQGRPPLKVVCLANSFDIANPIFMQLGLVTRAQKMYKDKVEIYNDNERDITLIILQHSPISDRKSKTSLYSLTSGSDYAEMAIKNRFVNDKPSKVKSMPLKEYRPLVSIGELNIYEHKSNGSLYASQHRSGSPELYSTSDADIQRVNNKYGYIWLEYLDNNIVFENYVCEVLLTKIFK